MNGSQYHIWMHAGDAVDESPRTHCRYSRTIPCSRKTAIEVLVWTARLDQAMIDILAQNLAEVKAVFDFAGVSKICADDQEPAPLRHRTLSHYCFQNQADRLQCR
jgi:hypothetical protein